MPSAAMAAAAWSWVEKMLHEAQRTSAPSAVSVSISTAVWMVMCSEPVMRAPLSGWLGGEFLADRHQAGHFGFGDADFLAAPVGQRHVGDDVVGELIVSHSVHVKLLACGREGGGLAKPGLATVSLTQRPKPGRVKKIGGARLLPFRAWGQTESASQRSSETRL